MPSAPILAESGCPAAVLDGRSMVAAPRGLPAAVHTRLKKALAETGADPAVRANIHTD